MYDIAIFNNYYHISGAGVFFFLLELIFVDQGPFAKSAKIKPRKIKVLHGMRRPIWKMCVLMSGLKGLRMFYIT